MHRYGTRPYLKLPDHNVAKGIIIGYSSTIYLFEASAYSGGITQKDQDLIS